LAKSKRAGKSSTRGKSKGATRDRKKRGKRNRLTKRSKVWIKNKKKPMENREKWEEEPIHAEKKRGPEMGT